MSELICSGAIAIILLAMFIGLDEIKEFIVDIIKAIKGDPK